MALHDELAIGDLVKPSCRHKHAAKLERENRAEKEFFTLRLRDSDRSSSQA
jgi:hypothetical protein